MKNTDYRARQMQIRCTSDAHRCTSVENQMHIKTPIKTRDRTELVTPACYMSFTVQMLINIACATQLY